MLVLRRRDKAADGRRGNEEDEGGVCKASMAVEVRK